MKAEYKTLTVNIITCITRTNQYHFVTFVKMAKWLCKDIFLSSWNYFHYDA